MSSTAIKSFRQLCARKVAHDSAAIVMVTAYDTPTMRLATAGGADIVLVGDSAAMVMLGYESTMSMTTNEMEILVAAVARAESDLPIVADMVWGSYHVSTEKAVKHAIDLVRAGAHAVKIEGGQERAEVIRAIVDAKIPVVGHVGLTPQSLLELGSYQVQGKDFSRAQEVLLDARAVEQAGASMIVVECVPDALSRTITEELTIPVIGIGAGRHVDGQVLVMHDLLGIGEGDLPKFVRTYADVENIAREAVAKYASDVREGNFPTSEETYHMADDVVAELRKGEDKSAVIEKESPRDSSKL
ncbi:MAG TPA: 3-methyl-2-oxobutanoate hydroxymethyltransferase [Acidimicrobiia bacterium]|nr:3-methyl-2-oxobutanoate hydroxymethyltransferase [Acidimicrobiia bacterium]